MFFTSVDGTTWEAKPVASLPQKFYVGEYPLLVDLHRGEWPSFCARTGRSAAGARTGRGQLRIGLRVREVPIELLREARAEAGAADSPAMRCRDAMPDSNTVSFVRRAIFWAACACRATNPFRIATPCWQRSPGGARASKTSRPAPIEQHAGMRARTGMQR